MGSGYSRALSFTTALSVDAALATVRQALARRKTKPSDRYEAGWSDAVTIGSRIWFRTWGVWGPSGYRRCPILVMWRAGQVGDLVQVDLRMTDDAGWYATYSQFFFRSLDRHFDEIEAEMRKALTVS